MQYNPQIHHRRSIRLKGYDYSKAGLYFITICCNDRECLFGEIVGVGVQNFEPVRMELNDAGKIADECWLEIPEHFPNVILHEYIVMPNHVHGIVELSQNVGVQNTTGANVGVQNFEPQHQQPRNMIPQRNEFQKIIPHSVGSIVKGYKIGVTKWFRNNTEIQKPWQRNFHEHIIRDEESYEKISNYIINNPKNWKEDKFYKS